MINFQEVTKIYGSQDPVLDQVSFAIDQGSFAYLVGPTGSGKTTIFRLIISDLTPTEGKITIGDWDLSKLPKSRVSDLRRKVGVVFQDLKLLSDRTVYENVILPLEFLGITDEARRRVEEILSEVALSGKEDKFPAQLSGGERQRVAIARALVFDPEVILADEPTGNLDTKTSVQIVELLKNINKKGTTVFMATHNDVLIDKDVDRVIVLSQGKIVEDRNSSHKKHREEEKDKKEEKVEKKEDEQPKSSGKIKLESLAQK